MRWGAGKDRRVNEVSDVGRSDDGSHDALTSRLTCPNHLRRDVGRVDVRANFGDNAPKKVLRTLPVAIDNSQKT